MRIKLYLDMRGKAKDGKSWIDPETKGGSGKWAMEEFWDTDDLSRANYLLNKYYVRPHKQEEDIPRRDIASQQALNIIGASKPAGIAALDRSNAPFARDLRMGSEQRGSLVDSYYPMQEANYKMAYGSDDEGAYVYPMIQKEGDELIDYSREPYDTFAADDAAHESGNLVRMPEEDAQWVAENNYKNYYPGFNTFAEGGNILSGGGTTWGEEGFMWNGPEDQETIVQGEAVPVPPDVGGSAVVARPSVSIAPPTLLQAYPETQMGLRNQIAVTNWGGTVPTAEQKALQDSIIANIDSNPVVPNLEAVLTPRDATRVVSPVYSMTPEAPEVTEETQMLEAVVRGDNTNKYIEDKIKALHNGEELRQFQEKLIDLGYDLHRFGADGKIGKETRAAARKYYKDMLEGAAQDVAQAYEDADPVISNKSLLEPPLERIDMVSQPGLGLQMMQDITPLNRIGNMVGYVIPSHTGAFINKLALGDTDSEIADRVESLQADLVKARRARDTSAIKSLEQDLVQARSLLKENKLNRKGMSSAEKKAVMAILTDLNGGKLMTYDDYLANIGLVGKQEGDYLGSNPRHIHPETGNEVVLYNGRSGYNLMNDVEDSRGYTADDVENRGVVRSVLNAERRIYNEPMRGRLGAFSYFIDADGNIHISDKLEATEAVAARGAHDDATYNRARDFFPRSSTSRIEDIITYDEYKKYVERALKNLNKNQYQ